MIHQQQRQRIVEEFEQSGMTRRQYCAAHDLSINTLDNWRRKSKAGKLIRVDVVSAPQTGFTLVLTNGRRIESGWRFDDGELARLIRAAEA